MKKRRIALFTAHTPKVGGGAAILRSLLAHLPELEVTWYYIGYNAVEGYEYGYLGPAVMGGPLLKDIRQTWQMLTMAKVGSLESIVQKFLSVACDAYWIVSHNEGLRIALELSMRQQTRPVHMTVHDDWAGALCARSVRYRLMGGPAKKLTVLALKAVTSVDVISAGMQDYYLTLSGRKADVCHRYLPPQAILPVSAVGTQQAQIVIGHIGSIYDKKDLVTFLTLSKKYFAGKGKSVLLQMWGCHLNSSNIPAALHDNIRFNDTLSEDKVIPELAKCDFVYCMYPLNKALHTFSKTSLPTKLSSYLQAARPVFGHGPADSTLAEFLSATGLGVMWSMGEESVGFDALAKVTSLTLGNAQWQHARERYFGENNLAVMNKALNGN